MPEGGKWQFTIFSNRQPADLNLTLSGSQCTDLLPAICDQTTGPQQYKVPCGELDIPPGCEPKEFNIAQVYPALRRELGGYPGPGCWVGEAPINFEDLNPPIKPVVPGVLCLATDPITKLLNVNAFVYPACCTNLVMQIVSLTKDAPGSRKCPETYRPVRHVQSGLQQIRTWWPLMYTLPGTKFTLTIKGRCLEGLRAGEMFTDTWCWTVVANPETFRLLIDWFHTSEIGLLEIPCIVGEDAYRELLRCADELAAAVQAFRADPNNGALREAAQNVIFGCESFLMMNTFFSDFVDLSFPFDYLGNPDDDFPNGPPPNLSQPSSASFPTESGFIGILDTLENPCACKLISDLDDIGIRFGILDPA
jgi:hypothetical protein